MILQILACSLNRVLAILGELKISKAPKCVPISSIGYTTSDGVVILYVYWHNPENEIVGMKYNGSWGPTYRVVENSKPNTRFAAAHWSDAEHLRLYYQSADNSVLEVCNDSDFWFDGAILGSAH